MTGIAALASPTKPSEQVFIPRVQQAHSQVQYSLPFAQPDNYIQYVQPSQRTLDQKVGYDCDEEDITFAETWTASHPRAPITIDELEFAMDRLEKESFYEQAQRENEKFVLNPLCDDDILCCICGNGDSFDSNQIVLCDGCNMAVHQECYGIEHVPEGDYLCRRCLCSEPEKVKCPLCPVKHGAFTRTDSTEHPWVHVACAIWMPGPRFPDADKMEPAVDLHKIDRQRYTLSCVVCKRKQGACIQCRYAQCTTSFHVTCAQYAGLKMNMEDDNDVELKAYCEKHGHKSAKRRGMPSIYEDPDAIPAGRTHCLALSSALHLFQVERFVPPLSPKAVGSPKIGSPNRASRRIAALATAAVSGALASPAQTAPGVPAGIVLNPGEVFYPVASREVVEAIYNYWLNRRQARNGPLVSQYRLLAQMYFPPPEKKPRAATPPPAPAPKYTPSPNVSSASKRGPGRPRKRLISEAMVEQRARPRKRVFSSIQSSDVADVRELRIEMERARQIVDLVRRRERLKKQRFLMLQQLVDLAQQEVARSNSKALRKCKAIMNTLKLHKFSWLFLDPVDPASFDPPLTDYFDIIKHPMDYGTILKRLTDSLYATAHQFAEDVRLCFQNCIIYNGAETEIGQMATTMSGLFEAQIAPILGIAAQPQHELTSAIEKLLAAANAECEERSVDGTAEAMEVVQAGVAEV
eukprot:TRINITY_DN5063_c0_g1_i1.p1 TRINITY_DN5063_c0_g1~~TRINITY_DN5063_c0_g1_i1.p1  ORF type:complete len:764 (-),score=127.57 TRINITY_DN5063_c0_g1_i1:1784-3859(-)